MTGGMLLPQVISSHGPTVQDRWTWPMTTRKPSLAHQAALLDTFGCSGTHKAPAQRACIEGCGISFCRFLCALQPHDRKAWAQRYKTLIKPGGQLATLIFPVDASRNKDEGPPFPVTPELYTELLTPEGVRIPS